MTTLEQQARDMLERAGVESAQSMTSGDLVEVANMMNEVYELRAALEQARALSEKWAAMKYNGDLTAAVYHGCAEELAGALSSASGGAA